jgi:hypothetical protein
MINSYISEYETETVKTSARYPAIIIRESIFAFSRSSSNLLLRIDIEAINRILNRLGRLVNKIDLEMISDLLFQPTFPWDIFLTFLERIHEFMGRIGLRMNEHFQIEFSQWVDYEVEGWSYLQIKIKLLERGIDKFMLLKSLISMATQILPEQTRREIVILVE